MKIFSVPGWVVYADENSVQKIDVDKGGKWEYFFKNQYLDFAEKICKEAVEKGIVVESKHTDKKVSEIKGTGVCCFYLNDDDIQGHKRIIQFFIDNNLIRKTKAGKYYNIPFKYNSQTRANQYGDDFKAEIKLENFMNLETGEWKK